MQKLQNSTLRKFLEFFHIVSINALNIKSNILSIKIRIHRKMQKYVLRIMKMTENHSIRIFTSIFYFSENQNKLFDENFIQGDENEKKYTSYLNTMISHVNQINIENHEI